MATIKEIKELRVRLAFLENEYRMQVIPCDNKQCGFNRKKESDHCSKQYQLIEECEKYIPKKYPDATIN